jgi:hypothetical protein
MAKQRPKAEPALRGRLDRYGYPVLRNPLCATSCIKRVTPTSRSRLINVCEEHTSTASSLRLDRPVRPTLVRKDHQDIIAYPSLLLSASSAVDLHRNCEATIIDALRSRQRFLGAGTRAGHRWERHGGMAFRHRPEESGGGGSAACAESVPETVRMEPGGP